MDYNSLRQYIRKMLMESAMEEFDSDMVDEERITNPESKEFVKIRQNFIGSHIFGEDLGDLGKMYVAFSYNEDYPAYVWHNNKWYHNTDDFLNPDGSINEFTSQHMEDMKPTINTHGLAGSHLKKMISDFMDENGIDRIDHTSVEPGQKNE